MGTTYFLLLVVLVAVAAYLVMRSFFRRDCPSFPELLSRMIPPPTEPVIPGTWGQVSELWRQRKNSALATEAADRFKRVIPACTDEGEAEELQVVHSTFVSNHQKLNRALMFSFASLCFAKITKVRVRINVANVTRLYAKEVLLLQEMSEVMDQSCVAVLEGQFLHGT